MDFANSLKTVNTKTSGRAVVKTPIKCTLSGTKNI